MTDHTFLAAPEPPPPGAVPPIVGPLDGPGSGASAARGAAAVSGAVAAGAALAVGELLAGLIHGIPSPLAAVGTAVIDMAPPGSKEIVISLFGTNDKAALQVLVAAVVLLAGTGIGLAARWRLAAAGALVVALVAVGGLASLRDPAAVGPLVVVAAALQVGVGLQVLLMLLTAAREPARRGRLSPTAAAAGSAPGGRRSFLLQAGAFGAVAVAAWFAGRGLLSGRAAAEASATVGGGAGTGGTGAGTAPAVSIPPAADPAPSLTPDAFFNVPGITPVVVPNSEFYRIDTAFFPPSVDLATWSLRVFGKVDKEIRLSYADLLQFPLIERYVTIACVSNEVGGNLVGNAKWTGVRLADVLAEAGVHPDATQVVPRSVDGWTAGFPTAWITDPAHPRDAIIALEMNGQPLPVEHGFPARLIVPGLYGYVSATKWLMELELTTLEAFDAYWVPRGWSKEAPILTQSRIDVPQTGATVVAGPVAVAGVAWAPDRGVAKVEVRVDGGPWQAAKLATELSAATWVQWLWTWQAPEGLHFLEVRATDGTGDVQTDQATPPDPDGARGHHRIQVNVHSA